MDVSRQEAQDALAQVEEAAALTRRALADGGTSTVLITWGGIWLVGFLTMHFRQATAAWIWLPLDAIGVAVTFVVLRGSPVRSPREKGLGLFWFFLLLYGSLWMMVIAAASPRAVTVTGEQVGAYVCTLVMFAYVVMGLWLRSALLFWLGLSVTAVTTASLFLLAPYFSLVMAFAGGGALIGAGVGIRRAWR